VAGAILKQGGLQERDVVALYAVPALDDDLTT
jgi:hypothetical protein